jgi:hypothetical protein
MRRALAAEFVQEGGGFERALEHGLQIPAEEAFDLIRDGPGR